MVRHSLIRLATFAALLAILLPVAAMAEACEDCPWSVSPDCCPPSCCSCCLPAPASAAVSAGAGLPPPLETGPASQPEPAPRLLASSRDVFHVPKSLRA